MKPNLHKVKPGVYLTYGCLSTPPLFLRENNLVEISAWIAIAGNR